MVCPYIAIELWLSTSVATRTEWSGLNQWLPASWYFYHPLFRVYTKTNMLPKAIIQDTVSSEPASNFLTPKTSNWSTPETFPFYHYENFVLCSLPWSLPNARDRGWLPSYSKLGINNFCFIVCSFFFNLGVFCCCLFSQWNLKRGRETKWGNGKLMNAGSSHHT